MKLSLKRDPSERRVKWWQPSSVFLPSRRSCTYSTPYLSSSLRARAAHAAASRLWMAASCWSANHGESVAASMRMREYLTGWTKAADFAMSVRVNKYRCYCVTEDAFVNVWDDKAPLACPNNSAHTIDPSLTTVVETVSNASVFVSKDTRSAGKGYYMYEGDKMEISFGQNIFNKTFPFDIRMFGLQFNAVTRNKNDRIDVIIGPDSIVGVLVADVEAGATTLTVSPPIH